MLNGPGRPAALLLLKGDPGPLSDVASKPSVRPASDEDEHRFLACAQCMSQITTPRAGISVAGSHEHTFRNPEGRSFRIGCFASVTGCVGIGPRSTYWTWFAGHAWQVALCRSCRIQLGWLFAGAQRFHGLILDRLVEADSA